MLAWSYSQSIKTIQRSQLLIKEKSLNANDEDGCVSDPKEAFRYGEFLLFKVNR